MSGCALGNQPPQGSGIRVGVAVDVSGPPDRQLDDVERLGRELRLGRGTGPAVRHEQRHVEPCLDQCTLPGTMTLIAPTVIDAQNPHPHRLGQ